MRALSVLIGVVLMVFALATGIARSLAVPAAIVGGNTVDLRVSPPSPR